VALDENWPLWDECLLAERSEMNTIMSFGGGDGGCGERADGRDFGGELA
jgi:hypothetical protein